MQWTWATDLILRRLLRNKAHELQDMADGDQGTHRSKIDAGHVNVLGLNDSNDVEQRRGTRTFAASRKRDKTPVRRKRQVSRKSQAILLYGMVNLPTKKPKEPFISLRALTRRSRKQENEQ